MVATPEDLAAINRWIQSRMKTQSRSRRREKNKGERYNIKYNMTFRNKCKKKKNLHHPGNASESSEATPRYLRNYGDYTAIRQFKNDETNPPDPPDRPRRRDVGCVPKRGSNVDEVNVL